MKEKGTGGGNTITGTGFEKEIDLLRLIGRQKGYEVFDDTILYNNTEVAISFGKHALYRYLKAKGIDHVGILSKKLLPDEAIYVMANNTLFIIEIKYQQVGGSTDEKLQTCDFKKKQYEKLVGSLKIKVEFIYLLNQWFRKPEYKDVLDYIKSVGCHYYFDPMELIKKLGFQGIEG
jgi:hypothetical protein